MHPLASELGIHSIDACRTRIGGCRARWCNYPPDPPAPAPDKPKLRRSTAYTGSPFPITGLKAYAGLWYHYSGLSQDAA